jgi:hypothetical protein
VFSGAAHGPGTVDTIARCDADSGEIEVLVQVGDELADEYPKSVQGRAYTSPIWYPPGG